MRIRLFKFLLLAGVAFNVATLATQAQVDLISIGSDWKYLDTGTDQGTAWISSGFSDAAWPTGPAELGYGEGDEVTTLQFGPNGQDKYPTYYFRHTFNLPDASSITNLRAMIKRDDGVVAYLNGTEIYRNNISGNPGETVYYTNYASTTASDDGNNFTPFSVDASLLVNGNNLVAVEIHQANATSSDISFDFGLEGNPLPTISINSPTNSQVLQAVNVAISGTAVPGGASISQIQVFADGALVGQSVDSDWTVLWIGVAPGDYTLTATLTDSSGLQANATPVDITVVAPPSGTLISSGSLWNYYYARDFVEPSIPSTLWRNNPFDDSSWVLAGTPIGYGEGDVVTTIPSSATAAGNYVGLYLRKTFNVPNPNAFQELTAEVIVDDGGVAYINGTEIGRINVPTGELSASDVASVADERRTLTVTIANPASILVAGENVMAVHTLNGNQTSSDILFNASLVGVVDTTGPIMADLDPSPGAIILDLSFVTVLFSEDVSGVDAGDLLINGEAATGLTFISEREYTFTFPPPETGTVSVAWAPAHGITDQAPVPNAFVPSDAWSYLFDPNADPTPTLRITEFLTNNDNGLRDEDGDREDWIEILNLGPLTADMGSFFLTDNAGDLTKWRFPDFPLDANDYLVVFASSKDRTNINTGPLHTNFGLSNNGEFLALVRVDFDENPPETNIVSAFSPAYPAQQADISFGRDIINPDLVGYYDVPTPGEPNGTSGSGITPMPIVSPLGGVYTQASLAVSITSAVGTIRYTTDGTTPTETSPALPPGGGNINLTGNGTVLARVFVPGMLPGAIAVNTYILLGNGVNGTFSSTLPIIIISTDGRAIASNVPPGGTRTPASFVVIDTYRGRASISDTPQWTGLGEIEIRGQTSAGFNKRPYGFELQDAFGNDIEVPLVGLPEESDWVLHNPYSDKSLMNNYLTYTHFEEMGQNSVHRRLVEVFVDETGGRLDNTGATGVSNNDYRGVYLLVDKIKIDNNRVDVPQLGPGNNAEPEVTGGYIFKKDKDSAGDLNFSSTGGAGHGGIPLKYHDPKPRQITTAQQNWLRSYVNAFEAALYAPDWTTRTGTNHYSWYIDVDSFVDHFWLVEFPKQIDGYRISAYFSKDRGGPIKASPAWDWNLAWGNADYLDGGNADGWYYSQISQVDNMWWRRLINGTTAGGDRYARPGAGQTGDPDFNQKIADRWSVLRTNVYEKSKLLAQITETENLLSEPAVRDFQRHPRLGTYIWPNPNGSPTWDVNYVTPNTYGGIMNEKRKWTDLRFDWVDGLFLKMPLLSSTGGNVSPGFAVSASSQGGTIYYTMNGDDPRASGGAISPGATMYTSAIVINDNATIMARSFNGTQWSGPARATFVVTPPKLIITELMYHPADPALGSPYLADDFEFIELKNVSGSTIQLSRYKLVNGINYDFANASVGSVAPGASIVLVRNLAAFTSRYGAVANVVGTYESTLDNAGERVTLLGPAGETVLDFEYDDNWHPATDGFGFSLVVASESQDAAAFGTAAGWRASAEMGGTPGTANGANPGLPRVRINEALTHTDAPQVDGIEIYNPGPGSADISGWFLSDDFRTPKFKIPAPTVVPANGYVVFTANDFGAGTNGFELRSSGDEVYIFSADGAGNLTGYIQGWEFDATLNGVSLGYHVNSVGLEEFVAQSATSLGGLNAGPAVGPLVISEIMYHPPEVLANGSLWNNTEDEFVEIANIGGAPVPMFDPMATTNTYRLRDAVDFLFPQNITLAAGERVLVVNFDPANVTAAQTFRTTYGIGAGIRLFGPYDGNLNNAGESVELVRPDQVVFYTTNVVITGVLIDKVDYNDDLPWPVAADGLGPALQRINTSAYGNDPVNWAGAAPSPGAGFTPGVAPTITVNPVDATVVRFQDVSFSVAATGPGPLTYQWLFNGDVIPGATSATLDLTSVDAADGGNYQVVVLNPSGSTSSTPAILTVLIPASIEQQPQQVAVAPGGSATFSIIASSSTQISYQWRKDGVPIQGATGASYTINNVQASDDAFYDVVLTDAVGSLASAPARLIVLIAPQFVNITTTNYVVQGGSLTLSVGTSGTLPMSYRWRKDFSTLKLETIDSHTTFWTIQNADPVVDGTAGSHRYSVVATNAAFTQPGELSPYFYVVVQADGNGNGLPDQWETDNGIINPDGDDDGDGVSNRDEYTSGTDPQDENSYLKVEGVAFTGTVDLQFLAAPGKTYTILYQDALNGGPWIKLQDVAGSTNARVVTISDDEALGERYYQLVTPRQE